jgi:hypothetical protein
MMRTRIIALLIALSTLLSRRLPAAESCLTCHPDVKTEFEQSVHAKRVVCTSCHGGDPNAVGLQAHAAPNYIGKPRRQDIPSLCASCHADGERMRASGLPIDQYAQYQRSEHGLRLAQGDTRVAVCTDCHGTHRILSREEPTSPVAARNVPATCARCHADAELMAAYGLPADQLEKFRNSVHGVALFVDEHPAAPTCATCHGAHGASDVQVTKMCGHCHTRTREYFEQSPHRTAVQQGKMSDCVSCHGYHDIAPPSSHLFETSCPACHGGDQAASATAQKLKTLVDQASASLDTAANQLAAAEPMSPTLARFRPRLEQARALFMEALPVQHSLAVERVADLVRSARSITDEVRLAVHGVAEQSRLRYLWLAVVWVVILFAVGVTFLYQRERRARAQRGGREPR